jgi:hypothetical protein
LTKEQLAEGEGGKKKKKGKKGAEADAVAPAEGVVTGYEDFDIEDSYPIEGAPSGESSSPTPPAAPAEPQNS